jgi:Zn-dependent peptidase ImmA (M78 family)
VAYRITEPELEVIVNEFFHEADIRGVVIPKENLIVCYNEKLRADCGGLATNYGPQRMVQINPKFKNTRLFKHVIFHELGHSLLGRGHVKHPSIMQNELLEPKLSKQFIDELFTF